MKSVCWLNFRRVFSSMVRQHFAKECEVALNKQINVELNAFYRYLAMVISVEFENIHITFSPICRHFILIAVMLPHPGHFNFSKQPATKNINMPLK